MPARTMPTQSLRYTLLLPSMYRMLSYSTIVRSAPRRDLTSSPPGHSTSIRARRPETEIGEGGNSSRRRRAQPTCRYRAICSAWVFISSPAFSALKFGLGSRAGGLLTPDMDGFSMHCSPGWIQAHTRPKALSQQPSSSIQRIAICQKPVYQYRSRDSLFPHDVSTIIFRREIALKTD